MSDRTVNINIKYNVNTADVQKAADLSNKAQASTDAFRASAQKAGQQVSQSFQTGGKSIAFMQTQLAQVKTQLDSATNPQKVAQLSAQFQALNKQLEATKKAAYGLKPAMDQTAASTKQAASGFGGLVTAAKLFLAYQIAKKTTELAIEMATLAGNVEGVERAFTRAIPNSVKLLDDLQKATHGTVDNITLMQNTLKAKNLGVPVQELAGLFEFATVRAQQTGESVDNLVSDIVNGLGRKSTRVIDNLGISATRLKDEFKGASLETLSVAEVTKGVSNIIKEEMDKMGGYVETSATKVAKLEVAWEALRITVAKKLENSAFIEWLTKATIATTNFIKSARQLGQEQARLASSAEVDALMESEAFKKLGDDQTKKIDFIQQEINTRVELIGRTKDHIKAIAAEREEIKKTNPYDDRIETLNNLQRAESIRQFTLANSILILKKYRGELSQTNDDETRGLGIIEQKQKEIEGLEKQLVQSRNISDLGRWGRLTTALEIAKAELGDLQRAFSEGIDPKKLDMDLKTAEHSLTNFGTSIKRMEDQIAELANMAPVPPPQTVAKLDTFWTEMGVMWRENWRDLTAASVDFQVDAINNLLESNIRGMQAEVSALKDHYQQRQALAGDNQRAQSELRIKEERELAVVQRRIFQKEKEARRAQAIIDGAGAVVKAFVTAPNVYIAIAQAAFIAATTAAQIRLINREQPRFAKGVIDLKGPGTGTSDSINARLSKGESVMTNAETKSSMGILKAIRNKELDDRVLKTLHLTKDGVKVIPANNADVVKAIKGIPQTDVIRQANTLYEAKTHGDKLYRKYRRKSMG